MANLDALRRCASDVSYGAPLVPRLAQARDGARNGRMLFIEAAVLLCVALFAQWRIAYFTRSAGRRWTARLVLALLGAAIGYTLVRYSDRPLVENAALFALGFSLVHVPAAIVLALKGWRREKPS